MKEVFGEILEKKYFNILLFELLSFFDILDIANAIFRKVLVLEARNFKQLIRVQ